MGACILQPPHAASQSLDRVSSWEQNGYQPVVYVKASVNLKPQVGNVESLRAWDCHVSLQSNLFGPVTRFVGVDMDPRLGVPSLAKYSTHEVVVPGVAALSAQLSR